jgi:hypothetical protein
MRTIATILVLAACSKGGGTKQANPELAAAAGPYAAEFSGFDSTAIAKKLQGTWVFRGGYDEWAVWSIEGTKVTEVDAKGTTTSGTLEVSSPCVIDMKLADGSGHPFGYVFAGDALHLGLGDSGAVVGATTYVCPFPSFLRMTGDSCEIQSGNQSENGKLSFLWEKTECRLDSKSFTAKDSFGHDVKFEVSGTALFDEQMKKSIAIKVADLAAGKAKQAELAATK